MWYEKVIWNHQNWERYNHSLVVRNWRHKNAKNFLPVPRYTWPCEGAAFSIRAISAHWLKPAEKSTSPELSELQWEQSLSILSKLLPWLRARHRRVLGRRGKEQKGEEGRNKSKLKCLQLHPQNLGLSFPVRQPRCTKVYSQVKNLSHVFHHSTVCPLH